ncbi:MAG: DEAD/DEAH box helicase [Micrococcales bacterium]
MENLSPAERYKKAKQNRTPSEVEDFANLLKFPLDDFQLDACKALASGRGVLVAAPTGAGKTVVGEFAIHLARSKSQKVFYTTPIKALSNQKYLELCDRYGADQVGLLTGDTNQNGDAPIVVMTTEVLRNMIYAGSNNLITLGFVVMDEVHYLADKFRGAVWEEVILHLPRDVKIVSLSATVSNAEEFGAWLDEVRGETAIIVSEHRPVPLNQHVLFGDELLELFDPSGKAVNPEFAQRHANKLRSPVARPTRGRRGFDGPQRARIQNLIPQLSKPETIDLLEDADLLPAIFFIFSRAGCESAVRACLQRSTRLTTTEEKQEIRRVVEEKTYNIADEDLATLGYHEWLSALERGVAAHHAGMLPAFKEVVEELFLRKLVKVVFATETLSLGINMPARTVVLDRLDKFNGESRVQITPGEYTQYTGRAGRRGIDTEGHSVIQWSANLDPASVAGLASRRTYPLISSFRPTNNMAVNLIEAFGRNRAREVLEMSFSQFQADRSVVGLAKGLREKQVSLDGYLTAMRCHQGDFIEYASMRREISDLERELSNGKVRAERGKDIRSTRGRTEKEHRLAKLKREIKHHDCHSCKDREAHARWAERYFRLQRELDAALAQIEGRTNQVARTFDKICNQLIELEYLSDEDAELIVLDEGRMLARIYGDRDLLVAECIRHGIWNGIDAANLVGIVASLVYEARRDEDQEPRLPRGNFEQYAEKTLDVWWNLETLSKKNKLPATGSPDFSISLAFHKWASNAKLDNVLEIANLLPGDFIRWSKQVIDLLEQIAQVADEKLSETSHKAVDAVKRGIVAYSYYN